MAATTAAAAEASASARLIVATHHLPLSCTLHDRGDANDTPHAAQIPGSPSGATGTWRLSPRHGHPALFQGIGSLRSTGDHQSDDVVHVGWIGRPLRHLRNSGQATPSASPSLAATDGTPKLTATPGTGSGATIVPDATVPIEDVELTDDLRNDLRRSLAVHDCVPVFLSDKVALGHYEGYCKAELWPVFHYILWDNVTDGLLAESQYWADYVAMNQAFADAIANVYRPGDHIWIHDYHLLLLPSMLRARLPDANIGFFLHTPFPSSEIFRCLPKRKEILEGVLGANLIGFQTYSYARHFISSCTRVLGLESSPKGVDFRGSLVTVGIFPIGIDVDRLEAARQTTAAQERAAALRELYAGKKIIIGRDNLDHVKGVQHKLNAFEKFLALYPEWRDQVVLVQVTSPPLLENAKLEAKVSEIVSRVNRTFGSLEFAPVRYYHQHLEHEEYLALLSIADVGLITSLRDGMNTTSHEFVVCQKDKHGPLILSEFTGTAGSLSAAILVNPWDYMGVANALHEALRMPDDERLRKHQQLYNYVIGRTVQSWAASFVKDLKDAVRSPDRSDTKPFMDVPLVTSRFMSSKKRMLLFDYDGTLTPIVKIPSAALPSPELLAALEVLAVDPKNYVFIISGRDQAFLEKHLGHIRGLGLSAEHGCFIRYPEEDHWINLAEQMDLSWKPKVSEIFAYYTERTLGSFVEHKRASITWHYRLADPDYGSFQAKECQNHLEDAIISKLPVEVMVGKKNLEVRPIAINKGEIVRRLLAARSGTDFVFCVGDDRTDEDMFRALLPHPQGDALGDTTAAGARFTCTVGPTGKKTSAAWHVNTPGHVISLLGSWAGTGDTPPSPPQATIEIEE